MAGSFELAYKQEVDVILHNYERIQRFRTQPRDAINVGREGSEVSVDRKDISRLIYIADILHNFSFGDILLQYKRLF